MSKKNDPSPEMIRITVERFRALADEARLRILLRLKQGECNVRTLVEDLDIAQATISKHLGVLRQSGVVTFRREGNQSFYRIKDDSVFEVCSLVCDAVKRQQGELSAALTGWSFEI